MPHPHLPYGSFSTADRWQRLGVRLDDGSVLDLAELSEQALLPDPYGALRRPTLDELLAEGRDRWRQVRAALVAMVDEGPPEEAVVAADDATMHLPFTVADYADFYSSLDHATNVGRMFRPDGDPLLPNWRHVPVAYHGRAGTVVVSGTDVVRPRGQYLGPDGPVFGPTTRLDVEAEVGFVVGVPSRHGTPVAASTFADRVFGVVLVNDWSARDIQAWEYQPLGPFLGKSFATSIAAWVTPLDALAAARVAPPAQDPPPFPYLRDDDPWSLDLRLELRVNGAVVSRPPFARTYWTPGQQLAHMTVNGASLRTGDLYASGTVSGPERDQRGSLLELTWNGAEPVALPDGSTRTFLEDGDEVVIGGTAPAGDDGWLVLGDVAGRVLPASGG